MKIHLVAIDLDGTLLNSANEISEASATILRTIRGEHNVHVVLASARPPRSVLPFYHLLELDAPMINYNGALVYDPPSRRVLLHTPVPGKIARGVADLARREYPDVLVSAEILDRWYTDRVDNAYVTQTGRLFRPDLVAPMDEWLAGPVTKLLLLGASDELRRIGRLVATEYRYQITVVQTESELLQITHPTVSKAQALKTVAGEMSVTREQVMAIGDNANDIEMLRWAGIGVAMANAPVDVQDAANYVTDFNDADGVAKAIRELIIRD
ncbi:MAG: Cof-type HAD-IIB family hydrolase [Planctomycetota bacterium]|jgi:Cof subfamily protein (haloacid dehalogenase superfamily)